MVNHAHEFLSQPRLDQSHHNFWIFDVIKVVHDFFENVKHTVIGKDLIDIDHIEDILSQSDKEFVKRVYIVSLTQLRILC
jgi:hypothetical protein